MKDTSEKGILNHLRKQIVFQFDDVQRMLQCSVRTARRRIKQWNAFSSLNENGSYYVLPEIPKFNENYIWQHNKIIFSKHRTLNKTISALVEASPAGITVFEANKVIGIPVKNILSQEALQKKKYHREKNMGMYVYYSNNHSDYIRQRMQRQKKYPEINKMDFPTDSESVLILVEHIKNPDAPFHRLAKCVKRRGVSVTAKKIKNLLEHHDIVKKTPN